MLASRLLSELVIFNSSARWSNNCLTSSADYWSIDSIVVQKTNPSSVGPATISPYSKDK